MTDSNKTGATSQHLTPLSNGKLRVTFETLSKHLIILSKAIDPQDLDSPEQFILWGAISQLEDLESHYEQLDNADTAQWMKEQLSKENNKEENQKLEPHSNFDLYKNLQTQCNRLEVAINSLSANHRNIPEIAVLHDVMNDLDNMEAHCSKVEAQQARIK